MSNLSNSKKNKVAIYTALYGNIDVLNEQPEIDNVDYYCFTDNASTQTPKIYNVLNIPGFFTNPVRSAKIFKIFPNIFLNSYEYTFVD